MFLHHSKESCTLAWSLLCFISDSGDCSPHHSLCVHLAMTLVFWHHSHCLRSCKSHQRFLFVFYLDGQEVNVHIMSNTFPGNARKEMYSSWNLIGFSGNLELPINASSHILSPYGRMRMSYLTGKDKAVKWLNPHHLGYFSRLQIHFDDNFPLNMVTI